MTVAEPQVYVEAIPTVIFYLYNNLKDTINHLKSIKLNIYPEDNVEYLSSEILVYADKLESDSAFKTGNLGYITCIFDNTYDSIFSLW